MTNVTNDAIAYLKALGVEVYSVPQFRTPDYISFRCFNTFKETVQALDDKACMDDGEGSSLPLGAGVVSEINRVAIYKYWDRSANDLTREITVRHNYDNEVTVINLQQHQKCQAWSNS